MKAREFAKYFAGFAANQFLTHGVMAAADTELTLFGIAYTRDLNTVATIVWAFLLAMLIYYAWMRRGDAGE